MKLDLPPVVKARLDPAERFGLRLTLFAAAVVLVAVPFATLTFQVLLRGPLVDLDGRLADTMSAWSNRHRFAVGTAEGLSLLGRPPVLAVWVLLAAVVLWRTHRTRAAIFVAVTALGGGIVDTVVKAMVDRPRPEVDHPVATAFGKSFPSGHAMSATVTYGALLVALWTTMPPRWRPRALVATVLLVLSIGGSRLVLGVHFASDVVGGYVLGLAWLLGSVAVFRTWTVEAHRDELRRRREERRARQVRPGIRRGLPHGTGHLPRT